jgi:hypothetical protein
VDKEEGRGWCEVGSDDSHSGMAWAVRRWGPAASGSGAAVPHGERSWQEWVKIGD